MAEVWFYGSDLTPSKAGSLGSQRIALCSQTCPTQTAA